jgi:pyruvate/2-oxoglutarate dehydrogenase complex dihydrolipoamide dehydrogenase (E3) component
MTQILNFDVCVIGAGSAGLSLASAAAQLGAKTVLFERGKMGGDCLNYGCIPSKALLAAAHRAQHVREAGSFGIQTSPPEINFSAVMRHVHNVIGQIAPHDSVERFESLGVKVIKAAARFSGNNEVCGGGFAVRAKKIVIATGSTAAVPPIPGLSDIAFLTNESIFNLSKRPDHLLVIGGGPIGIELAQAFRRLGSDVTVFEGAEILQKDDPDYVNVLRQQLRAEGVTIREGVNITGSRASQECVWVKLDDGGEEIMGTHLLVATGRKPNTDGLDLERAGVAVGRKGIEVDRRLRTSNPNVYAIGDVTGGPQFTHVASYHAGIAVRNALFRLRAKVDYRALPWVTYTDPELAHVGLTESQARQRYGDTVQITQSDFSENDRSRAEQLTEGGVKVITHRNGTVLGATILGGNAGELIAPWALVIEQNRKLKSIAGLVFPYPTRSEVSKAAASKYYAPKLFSKWPKRLVRALLWFG